MTTPAASSSSPIREARRCGPIRRRQRGGSGSRHSFKASCPTNCAASRELLQAPESYRFTDSRSGFVSIINLASVADLEERIGAPVDPLRFRGNVMVEGLEPWAELDLVGRELATASGLRLQVIKRIERCAATNVDPQTGIRDLQIPKTLMTSYGHVDCGIYCRVVASGTLSEGDRLETVVAPAPLGIA